MLFLRHLFVLVLMLSTPLLTSRAQQPTPTPGDAPTLGSISFEAPITDTITERAIFDRWTFTTNPGDLLVVTLRAADGLAPLVGLGTVGGDLLYSSDGQHEGQRIDAEPNAVIEFDYRVQNAGEYVIIVTRAGNDTGTTTGSYTLTLRRIVPQEVVEDTYQDVVFRCGADEVTTAATLQWAQEPGESYRISVYGLDGFRPVLRVAGPPNGDFEDCGADSQDMGGDRLALPGETEIILPANSPDAVRFTVQAMLNEITLTLGSIDGTAGRYLLVIEGFTIAPAREIDLLTARVGPLAARDTEMLVYMIRRDDTRIDPLIQQFDTTDTLLAECDDAGRGACEAVPAISDLVIAFNNAPALSGSRLDAGLRLRPGNPNPMYLSLTSRNRAEGEYALVIFGALPPRSGG